MKEGNVPVSGPESLHGKMKLGYMLQTVGALFSESDFKKLRGQSVQESDLKLGFVA